MLPRLTFSWKEYRHDRCSIKVSRILGHWSEAVKFWLNKGELPRFSNILAVFLFLRPELVGL